VDDLCRAAGDADRDAGAESAGTWPYWYAAVIELVGGTLVLLGIGTRSAAFIASGSMAYAYFTVHQPDGLFPVALRRQPWPSAHVASSASAAHLGWFLTVSLVRRTGERGHHWQMQKQTAPTSEVLFEVGR
jgi:uncharacterized membrane protein YphA (DoxX/SURF4 family)